MEAETEEEEEEEEANSIDIYLRARAMEDFESFARDLAVFLFVINGMLIE